MLSYQVAARVAEGRLGRILEDAEPPSIPVSVVFPANRRGSANVRAFIAAAREELRSVAMG